MLGQFGQLPLDGFPRRMRFADHVQPDCFARLDVPSVKTFGVAQRALRTHEHERPDFESASSAGVDLAGLKRGQQPVLCQGIDPDRIKKSQLAGQPPDLRPVTAHLSAGSQPQPLQQRNELFRRLFHGSLAVNRPDIVPACYQKGSPAAIRIGRWAPC